MQQSSDSIGSLAAALARAQVELINPEKSMVATIRPEGRGATEQIFRYAPLSDGLNIIRKTLGQHETATLQSTSIDQVAGLIRLKTVLAHSSGEWISSDWPVCPLEDLASPKRMGAALTYARRYALFALAGIAGEDDLDAPNLHETEPIPKPAYAVSNHRAQPNGGDGHLGQKLSAKPKAEPSPLPAESGLRRKLSAVLRDKLLHDVGNLNSAEGAAVWARRILPAKNTLHEADARQLEEAFQAKLTAINGNQMARVDAIVTMSRKPPSLLETRRPRRQFLQVMHQRSLTRANLPIPSRVASGTRTISDLSRPNHASSVAAHLPIPTICASLKAALYLAK